MSGLTPSNPLTTSTSRRRFLGNAGLVGAGLWLTSACGPGSTGNGSTDGGGSGEVNFYHWRAEDRDVIDELIAAFTSANSGLSVTQTIEPSEQYQATAAQKARDGAIGDALTAFRGAQFQQFVDQGVFTDLSGADYASNYVESLLSAGEADGRQYGFPYQLVFNQPLLNEDLAEQAGLSEVPTDWDAYLSALEAFRGIGVDPIVWPGNDPAGAFQIINSLAMNHLPEENAFAEIETGKYQVTESWWISALEQFQELSQFFQNNFAGATSDGVTALFSQGQAAILPTGSYQIGQVRGAGATFPIEFAPLITTGAGQTPTYEGVHNATFILGVNQEASNAEGAQAWLEFLSQPENAAVYANGTAQHVTVTGVEYDDPDLAKLAPWAERNTILAPRFQFNNLDIRSAVENSLVAVATGTSPEEAAETAQNLIDQNL